MRDRAPHQFPYFGLRNPYPGARGQRVDAGALNCRLKCKVKVLERLVALPDGRLV